MPTKQLSILLKILASLVVRRSQILTPSGRKTASHFSTAAENTGICRRSRPMPGHWEPIPEKTYQSGSFTLSVFWKQSFICDVDLHCNLYKQHIYYKTHSFASLRMYFNCESCSTMCMNWILHGFMKMDNTLTEIRYRLCVFLYYLYLFLLNGFLLDSFILCNVFSDFPLSNNNNTFKYCHIQ